MKQKIRNGFLLFLRNYFNPLTLRLARTSFGPFAIVRHVGRRSGKHYETPFIVQPADKTFVNNTFVNKSFVIALTYGPNVDWYQNVLAAGGCSVLLHGAEYVIDQIELLDTASGRAAFPLPERLVLGIVGVQHFAKLVRQL
jgi:deazaflavin-dependent oxidoreductase (nitroreductase family)